ncbi:TIGR03943 family protein [Bacillus shivajii]|uniref:TIGR03943 family putative permease subunit n=1 Tax=Bacillus shivajii TaxID=1983719 RepID=UPI001CF9D22B|nr:TIGR03943 family protein [Bacillus shivajii]UCZ54681.1 TIGR03943 family protein [Bacillus shivajii]
MKKYDHSFHAYIQGTILIGFALLILGLIISGNIVYYIAPTMMPFIYFALVVFFLLGLLQVFRSTKKDSGHEHGESCNCEHDHRIPGPSWVKVVIYSVFILPILSGFVLPDRMLDSSIAANRGIQYGSGLFTKPVPSQPEETSEADSSETSRAEAYLEDPDEYISNLEASESGADFDAEEHYTIEDFYDQEWFDEYYIELAEELEEQDVITVTEDNYLDIMTVLDLHLEQFEGKKLEIIGFAYREPDFEDHQLVAARFSMTCCTADAAIYGTLIESEDAKEFEEDTWFYAMGTIEIQEYNGYKLPVLVDSYLHEVEEPDTPYVYPSFR